ncbi:hypothetical protein D039_3814B, partial [Vibrio parahaemolyticus EKP-028]
ERNSNQEQRQNRPIVITMPTVSNILG